MSLQMFPTFPSPLHPSPDCRSSLLLTQLSCARVRVRQSPHPHTHTQSHTVTLLPLASRLRCGVGPSGTALAPTWKPRGPSGQAALPSEAGWGRELAEAPRARLPARHPRARRPARTPTPARPPAPSRRDLGVKLRSGPGSHRCV